MNEIQSQAFCHFVETNGLILPVVDSNFQVQDSRLFQSFVQEAQLVLEKGEDNKFALEGLDAAKEETNVEKVTEIGNTLGEIKIVGVRPKPEGLTARLERANGFEAAMLRQQLQAKGYFLARGRLYSNEGDLVFETKSGVRYTLRFGELVYGEGDEVSAGIGAQEAKEGAEKPAANNRYLMVTAEFVADLLDKPTGPRLEQAELDKRRQARTTIEAMAKAIDAFKAANERLPESFEELVKPPGEAEPFLKSVGPDPWGNEFQFTKEGDTYVVLSYASDGKAGGSDAAKDVSSAALAFEDTLDAAAAEWQTYDGKVKTGQEEADKLTRRFGPWYYVIDKELFDKLKPKREDLVQPKTEEGEKPDPGK